MRVKKQEPKKVKPANWNKDGFTFIKGSGRNSRGMTRTSPSRGR